MPLQATSGAASYDAFGGGVAAVPNYIEEVFSTWLYTGNGSTQTITNGIDLAGKGGLVWLKARSQASTPNMTDTVRGAGKLIYPNLTNAEATGTWGVNSFNSNGFQITGADGANNGSGTTYASWTFRKQPKFFDVVTWTGDGSGTFRNIPHNLGSVPGCIIYKRTDAASDWNVYHRSLGNDGFLQLNTTGAEATPSDLWNYTDPTSTQFTVGYANTTGRTYVAYLFAHNAGGFGLTGTDNVISCGSFTTNSSGNLTAAIDLGYEPQWVLYKQTNSANGWSLLDNMRGMPVTGDARELVPNTSGAESGTSTPLRPTATGLTGGTGIGDGTFIYIAIRRGPMAVPTTGTSVFEPVAYSGTGTNSRVISSSITPDSVIPAYRNTTGAKYWYDRLRGNGTYLITTGTNAEGSDGAVYGPQFNSVQTGYVQGTSDSGFLNNSSYTYINWLLKRAPGFFDEVCYTGTGSTRTVTHNLTVAPELMIVKRRNTSASWWVYAAPLGATKQLVLNTDAPENVDSTVWNDTAPTASVFTLGTLTQVNGSGSTFVAYLFASCPGVSKVGSYTGNGSSQTINCGFTGGARFVLIKRTDSTGDWYVWDTARGIVSGNDPHLSLNTTAAEVTSNDTIDTDSTGFVVNQVSATNVNVSSATYIFMAVA